ncbi:hypothetical protein [Streptococcus pyogenes]|nr:hypothetical protein [Streptococcus pyogenes]
MIDNKGEGGKEVNSCLANKKDAGGRGRREEKRRRGIKRQK